MTGMKTFRAIVEKGRLIVLGDVSLPDGTELDLSIVDAGDDLGTHERKALHDALHTSWEAARRGELQSAEDLLEDGK